MAQGYPDAAKPWLASLTALLALKPTNPHAMPERQMALGRHARHRWALFGASRRSKCG